MLLKIIVILMNINYALQVVGENRGTEFEQRKADDFFLGMTIGYHNGIRI